MKFSLIALLAVAATAFSFYGCNTLAPVAPPQQVPEPQITAAPGRYLGFDTYGYPGDHVMRAWRADSPFEWVGYYLPAPCHRGSSWTGKRERLTEMGWGMAVIYVGQQWWPKPPPNPATRRAIVNRTAPCANFRLHGAEGRRDANDAIARTLQEGFPAGTVIFLDLEYMTQVPQGMRDYYRAWVNRVLEDGHYRPGIYVHTRNAAVVHPDVKAIFAQHDVREEPSMWIAGGGGFSREKFAHEGAHDFATVWQGILDIRESWSGATLHIDVNVASLPSPSTSQGVQVVAAGD